MNKPVAFICACIAGLGLAIVACSSYFTIVYGRGDFEAGNFHRCVYSKERDPVTGMVRIDWDTRWDLVESTEGSPLAQVLDMWVLGFGMIVLGAGIYAFEWSSDRRKHSFLVRTKGRTKRRCPMPNAQCPVTNDQ